MRDKSKKQAQVWENTVSYQQKGRVVLGACHSECKAVANKEETKQLETKEKS